jgi:hypothetical protein
MLLLAAMVILFALAAFGVVELLELLFGWEPHQCGSAT